MTISDLRKLAKEVFPGTHPGLVHLLCAWAERDPGGGLAALLEGSGLGTAEFRQALDPLLAVPADEDKDLLMDCIVRVAGQPVTGRHLLQALCDAPTHRVSNALAGAGTDLARLSTRLAQDTSTPAGILAQLGITIDANANPLLEYGRDLTALAAEGAFGDLCDRPKELDRLFEVLLRKQKANPVLTGPAGVGKTALVELLARTVAAGPLPGVDPGTRIFELRMGKVVAGTKYRGQFEERMERVIQALLACQPAILFIDEMHLLWGTGRAEGAPMDAGNLLKPLLARGSVRVIGATTVQEYQQYIARDEALARRFQEVRLQEPDPELTLEMVRKQADGLARHHEVSIPENVVKHAIELTNRHVPNRWQPDKSIDLLDTSAVNVRRKGRKELTAADLLETLSRQTGRPIAALTGEDRESLRSLSNALKKRVIGQDHAINKVTGTLIQRRQDLGPPERNLGTFLFAGDTGVGKTELARAIAAVFFGKDKALLHLDMAECNGLGGVNKLIGSPPGFVGSEEEGTLIAWLHTQGSGVLLFDEIEKAHPEVRRLLLGLLDNGRIHSARGQTMDTRQCVVVLTTNAITLTDLDRGSAGFKRQSADRDPSELLADHFPREFLGRLDEIILFNRLGPKEMRQVIKLRLDESLARLSRRNIRVTFDEDRLLDHLLEGIENFRPGARGITRLLEEKLLQPISMAMLQSDQEGELHIGLADEFYKNGTVTAVASGVENGDARQVEADCDYQ